MNGYNTGGDWTDITSIGRNEVVFEGRHKEYGAFYIRKRYPNALYVSFLSAILFLAAGAVAPYAFRNIKLPEAITKPDVVISPINTAIHPDVLPKPVTPPHVKPPKPPTVEKTVPLVTKRDIDTIIMPNPDVPSTPGNATPGEGKTGDNLLPGTGNNAPPIPNVDNGLLLWVSEMPKFPGGSIEEYLRNQINYPAEESQLGIQGIVYASFIIEKDGSVSTVTLKRGVSNGPGLNREAIRVLEAMPKWTPGKQDGHPVRIQYTIPIHFKLQ